MQQQWKISQSDYDVQCKVDFIQQPATALGQRGGSKACRKVKLAPKNVMVTVWWSAAHLIHYSFLNPSENIISEKYAQKSMRRTANYNACSRHLSIEWAQFFSMTTSNHTLYNQCFKSWTNWAMKFCIFCHIHLTSCQLTTTSQQVFASTTSRKQKMLSKCSLSPEA